MRRHLTPARPWQPLSDSEWLALLPHLRRAGRGRPIPDLRARMDAIFHIAATGQPWGALPEGFGKPDTVARCFRRLTHGGLWPRLLAALALPGAPPALRALEHWVCRASRRATRLLGLRFIVLIRRLGFLSALKGPPWMVANPDLSETIRRFPIHLAWRPECRRPRGRNPVIAALMALHRFCGGRRYIPKCLEPA